MCGINGIIKHQSLNGKTKLFLEKMNNSIIHRGPDDEGYYTYSQENYSLGMAMRRLAIIDLTTGHQPIFSDDGQIAIVFNGEIYNFPTLRNELISEGVHFKTKSDTEVILKLYEKKGAKSFSKLDGMYAFSIHDKKKQKVYIARDYFGEKPLYYTQTDNAFLWGSELKSIIQILDKKPDISIAGLNYYFRLTYVPAPFTIYEGIHKLEANHYMVYDLKTNSFDIMETVPFEYPEKKDISFLEAKEKVKKLVMESVESRSISDVPLGTFLSGGVDSSIVSLCLARTTEKKINTFSIGFEKSRFDETDKSKFVAKMIGSNHHEFVIGERHLKDKIHDILVNFDEPFSDTAALPTELVSRRTREHVTVALTGDGGDEVFGGYNKYYIGKMNARYQRIIPKKLHNALLSGLSPLLSTKDDNRGKRFKIRKLLNAIDYNGESYWDIISLNNTKNQIKDILQAEHIRYDLFDYYKTKLKMENPTTLTNFRLVDWVLSLEGGMLPKVDRTSMLNSLECRAPFLNKEIWDFTNSLPESFLMNKWNKKYILKEAFRDEFPENFLDHRKSGFGSPVGDWLKLGLRDELESYIEVDFLEKQNIFNIDSVIPLVKNHVSGKRDNTFRVWGFYCFQKWYSHCYMPN